MSPRRHDLVFAALGALEATLRSGDAVAAQRCTETTLALLASTAEPGADERLLPAFARCQALATELRARLHQELQGSAVSSRAAQAYEREVERQP